jgi:NAD(P)-dependent dehydrogenase (short-subunit alcohol dehydrogenase family)
VVPELVRIIRCNAIAPGFIETDSNWMMIVQGWETVFLWKRGTTEDVANACLF